MVGGFESKLLIDSVGVRGPACGPESDSLSESDHSVSEDSSTLFLHALQYLIPPLYLLLCDRVISPKVLLRTVLSVLG